MLNPFAFRASAAVAGWAFAALAQAAPLNVSFDNFTYSGTVTRYNTLADAQSQTNALGPATTIQTASNGPRNTRPNARDGNLAVTSAAPSDYGTTLTYLSTAWYFTTTPANGNGWGNPNNTNDGFIQYYLTSSPTVTGGWQPGYTQFQLGVVGGDGDTGDNGRFWPTSVPGGGAANISRGSFVDFNLHLSANFASAATLNGTTNWYETTAMPSSMSGTLTGIFHNNQTFDTSINGFYRFSYTVTGPGSWAADNVATWNDGTNNIPPASLWAAPAAVVPPTVVAPVPGLGPMALLGLSLLLGLMVAVRQNRHA